MRYRPTISDWIGAFLLFTMVITANLIVSVVVPKEYEGAGAARSETVSNERGKLE